MRRRKNSKRLQDEYWKNQMALLHDMGLSGLDLEHKDMPASEPRLFDF